MDLKKWVEALDELRDWNAEFRELDALLRNSERETLVKIAQLCVAPPRQTFGRRSIYERIIEMLALTPDRENVLALRRLFELAPDIEARAPRIRGEKRVRYLASMLASAQTPADLLELGDWARDNTERRDLVACCIGELVLRDRLHELPVGAAREVWQTHSFSAMPLQLLPVERDFPALLPQYGGGSSACSYAYHRAKPSEHAGVARGPRPASYDEDALQSALANWAQESNGKLASGVWNWFDTVKPDEFGLDILRSLPCEAVEEISEFARVGADAVLDALFSSASSGGAYNSGEYGAWGRWHTWRSLAALVGIAPESSPTQIAARAEKCGWFNFAGPFPWFYDILNDIGFACLRPDGRSVAILAGTDTD